MTMATPNDINPTFEWKPEYLVQLQHIADTDEFQPDDTAHPQLASTSSASGASASSHSSTLPAASQPSGAYDWQILKEAIKYRIRTCLEQEFGRERGLELHPAAALMPWMQPGADMEVTWHRANMGLLCSEAGGGEGEAMEVSGDDGEGATASASVEEGNTDVTESAEAGADHAQTNGTSEATATTTTAPSAATATAAAASSATSADELSQYAYRARLNDSNLIHPPFVHRADVQSFYPSKRPPPPPPSTSTTLPLLTPNQLTTHLHTLYTMLEDFDVQPPFTIQRLCELLVAPTAHYNSASKWIAALKRCLSVTATRDAFPISPVQRAAAAVVGGVGANGCGGGGGGGGGVVSEVEMDRMDGLGGEGGGVGSRGGSVGGGEPLFSPIPFIVRGEENGRLMKGVGGGEGGGEGMDQIPDLELGGADRTQSADVLPKEVVDVAPTVTAIGPEQKDERDKEEGGGGGMEEESPATTTVEANTVAAAVEADTSSTGANSASTSEPLGLPDGALDELGNPTHTVNPLTSTTSTTTSESAQTAQQVADDAETREQSGDQEDAHRSSKRRKSIASLHDE